MQNRVVGIVIIGIAALIGFVVFSFNRALTGIVNTSCSHGSSCSMWSSIDFQTNVGIGILLFDRAYWRKGWASKVIETVIRFAIEQLGVNRFWAGMRRENLGSRKTFEGLGFVYQPSADWTASNGGVHHFFLRQ